MRAALALLVVLAGCVNIPDSYAPPVQRRPLIMGEAKLRHFVHMNDPAAPAHFVEDIGAELHDRTWRWTGKHPVLRFTVPRRTKLRLAVDLAITDHTFKDTGPVTIDFLIMGKRLDRVRYDKPGNWHFEKAIPDALLPPSGDVLVSMDIDKLWKSPEDGAAFGFILTRAGFLD